MDRSGTDELVQQVLAGFTALQDEYKKLLDRHAAVDRKLATAREQYNEVVRQYGSGATTTPPLSLSSSPGKRDPESHSPPVYKILERAEDDIGREAGEKVRTACTAAKLLQEHTARRKDSASGVKIWSGRSADRLDVLSSAMPSISESPLEQDFTIEGVPSKLGCPFATMKAKKLSSHAASVLSRYEQDGAADRSSVTSAHRMSGKNSLEAQKSRDRRSSLLDPIKAEICGLSDHDTDHPPLTREAKDDLVQQADADVGLCPIRFLDQHSPEEVATYFERHKHELPRSHEVCVRRYQSNEQQIRELDAKYGNLVSMIQGLGAKHKEMLPAEPDDDEAEAVQTGKDAAKIQKWASSVSAVQNAAFEKGDEDDQRQSYFDRPLRDVRVGESPSRPWGIRVPAKYTEAAVGDRSEQLVGEAPKAEAPEVADTPRAIKAAGCPFGHGKRTSPAADTQPAPLPTSSPSNEAQHNDQKSGGQPPRIVFNGPVFLGYSPEDAVKFLQHGGLAKGLG